MAAAGTRAGGGQSRPAMMRATRPRGRKDGAASSTIDEIEAAAADGVAWLRNQVLENPWPTIGAAAATGWLLGGGLTPRLVGLLVATAGRLAMSDVVSAAIRGAMHAEPSAAAGADDES
jgi:hypothetical protein